jgi:hypothetical protein
LRDDLLNGDQDEQHGSPAAGCVSIRLLGRLWRAVGAVTQIQKTVFDFTRNRFRDRRKDDEGNDAVGEIYAVDPRSYLVIGNLVQLQGNDDKVACFELYRRNIRAPEILTFDELYQRAKCIVENVSREPAVTHVAL